MIPLILGGVTLAVVAYGVKEFIEGDIDRSMKFDETVHNAAKTISESIDDFTFKHCMIEGCEMERDEHGNFQLINSVLDESSSTIIPSELKSKEFHKHKKSIYKTSMKKYAEFLETKNIKPENLLKYTKLEKQMFADSLVKGKLSKYMSQISDTLEILAHNHALQIDIAKRTEVPEDALIAELNKYANAIAKLSHLKLYENHRINEVEILSTLVQTMEMVTQKDTIHVSLESA